MQRLSAVPTAEAKDACLEHHEKSVQNVGITIQFVQHEKVFKMLLSDCATCRVM
jgi:hypothetical protein